MANSTVYHTLISYTPTADSEVTGYEDNNLVLRPVRRSWRSDSLTDSPAVSPVTLTLDTGSSNNIEAVLVWDTNIHANGIDAEYSADGNTWTTAVAVPVESNAAGRRYALYVLNGTARYIRLSLYGGTLGSPDYPTSDGANYLEIGRIAVFSGIAAYPFTNPLQVNTRYPTATADLLNGRRTAAGTGEPYAEITLSSNGYNYGDYNFNTLRGKLNAGPVCLDADCYGAFLIEESSDQFDRSFEELRGSYTLQVREVV